MNRARKNIGVLREIPTSVRQALRGMLDEERRQLIEDDHDITDVNRMYRVAVFRLEHGTLSECIHCGGMISMERAFLENNLFTMTCSEKCSYREVMHALEIKITEISASLSPKRSWPKRISEATNLPREIMLTPSHRKM
jgi:RNA polymerase-binding transcription factor DksA